MPVASFTELMAQAERGGYAVGYFESWNLESLLAVADAAERTGSPVLLGFSGLYLTHQARRVHDPLGVYAAMGLDVCRRLSVPSCLVFNECPDFDSVLQAVELGFSPVMFSDGRLSANGLTTKIRELVGVAHRAGVAVEAELAPLEGVAGDWDAPPDDVPCTDPAAARLFVEQTGIDALAVNVGQVHLHGRREVSLRLDHLRAIRQAVNVPLVLHGASSIKRSDLRAAIDLGVRKINVGSRLKQAHFEALRQALAGVSENDNPYEVIGSGLDRDVLVAGRVAMQGVVEDYMRLFGSAGRATATKETG